MFDGLAFDLPRNHPSFITRVWLVVDPPFNPFHLPSSCRDSPAKDRISREGCLAKRVLLIEDEPNIIAAISFILSRDGWMVHNRGVGHKTDCCLHHGMTALTPFAAHVAACCGEDE
jgi:hypothetical protein